MGLGLGGQPDPVEQRAPGAGAVARSRGVEAVRDEVAELDRAVAAHDVHGLHGRRPAATTTIRCCSACVSRHDRSTGSRSASNAPPSGAARAAPATWGDFWNLWSGNDNAGENVDPEDEPGNQLAGWDIRWASPIGDWPYALYFQHTGESIDNQIPRPYRSLELAGAEVWGEDGGGASWRVALEWALTRCGGTENGEKLWDCAYNSPVFNVEGYRYYGRPLGHSMDGDGEMFSLRYVRVGQGGSTWTAVARYTEVNQGGFEPDERHSYALGPEQWTSLDLVYRHPLASGWLEAGVGADQRQRDWNDSDALLGRAYLSLAARLLTCSRGDRSSRRSRHGGGVGLRRSVSRGQGRRSPSLRLGARRPCRATPWPRDTRPLQPDADNAADADRAARRRCRRVRNRVGDDSTQLARRHASTPPPRQARGRGSAAGRASRDTDVACEPQGWFPASLPAADPRPGAGRRSRHRVPLESQA